MKYGTVTFFNNNPGKLFGFIDDTIFFHRNGARVPVRKDEELLPKLQKKEMLRMPSTGNRVVFEVETGPQGLRAKAWAFEDEYNARLHAVLIPMPGSKDGMATPEEMLDVLHTEWGLLEVMGMASASLHLTNAQVGIFIRNTPGGKKGEELFREFRTREAAEGDGYNFATFVREVLAEAGQPWTGPGW